MCRRPAIGLSPMCQTMGIPMQPRRRTYGGDDFEGGGSRKEHRSCLRRGLRPHKALPRMAILPSGHTLLLASESLRKQPSHAKLNEMLSRTS